MLNMVNPFARKPLNEPSTRTLNVNRTGVADLKLSTLKISTSAIDTPAMGDMGDTGVKFGTDGNTRIIDDTEVATDVKRSITSAPIDDTTPVTDGGKSNWGNSENAFDANNNSTATNLLRDDKLLNQNDVSLDEITSSDTSGCTSYQFNNSLKLTKKDFIPEIAYASDKK